MSFFRSRSTIQSWVDEFERLRYPLVGEIRVLEQDGGEGDNTGLVVVQLAHAETSINIQPREIGSPWWVTTVEVDEAPLILPAAELVAFSANLTTVSALCAFLEAKSSAFVGEDTSR